MAFVILLFEDGPRLGFHRLLEEAGRIAENEQLGQDLLRIGIAGAGGDAADVVHADPDAFYGLRVFGRRVGGIFIEAEIPFQVLLHDGGDAGCE